MVGMAIGHMWQLTHQAPCIMAHKATRYASLRIHCPSRLALRLLNTKNKHTHKHLHTHQKQNERKRRHTHTYTDTLYICTHCYCCYKLRIKNTSKIRNPKEIHTPTHTYRQRRHTCSITEAAAAQRSSSLSSRQLKQSFSEASSSGDNNSDSVTRAAKSAAWK